MDIGVLIGFVACAVVLALAMDLSGSTVRTVGGMFHAPDLGWPSGVQEDDDLQWSWARGHGPRPRSPRDRRRRAVARSPRPRGGSPNPRSRSVDSRSIRLQLQPIRRGSH